MKSAHNLEDVLSTSFTGVEKEDCKGWKVMGLYVRGRSIISGNQGRGSSRSKSKGKGTYKLTCYICYSKDHLKKDCPKRNKKKSTGFVKKNAGQGSGMHLRVYDIGVTCRWRSSMVSVLLSDNRACAIMGIGKVRVQMKVGSSFVLENVRYIPELKRNLISLGTVDREDYTVKLQNGRVKVIKGSLMVLSGTIKGNCMYSLDGWAESGEASIEATVTAAYLINRYPSIALEKKTPMDLWSGHMARYPEGVKGYRLWRLDDVKPKIIISRDVVFNESLMYKDNLKGAGSADSGKEVEFKVELQGSKNLDNYVLVRDRAKRTTIIPARYRDEGIVSLSRSSGSRVKNDMAAYAFAIAEEEDTHEPITFHEAINSFEKDEWVRAMEEEMSSLKKNHTWELVDQPPDYELEQLDLKTTVLHGNLDETIYMRQPPSFKEGTGNKVCLLKKSLYGHKQSLRQWYKRFDVYMVSNGFSRSNYDSCVTLRSLHQIYNQTIKMADQDTPLPTITAMKVPIIKKGEYDIWSMRMQQYICHTDHNLWDIIINGDLQEEVASELSAGEQTGPPAPKTDKQLAAKKNQERVKSILLLAIPDEYLLKFHNVPDAKSLWAAIKLRFGGNDESKKMQKNVLKHQFENFITTPNESLDKAYDRFQKLISQLEIHGASVSKEDINQKFLRSIPPSWSQIALIMRNKPDIDQIDTNDLYNNLSVYENEIKGSSSCTTNSQNLAFLSSKNTSSTNEVNTASGDFGVSTAAGTGLSSQVSSTPCADEVMCSFFAQQTTSLQLENEDLTGHFDRECKSERNKGKRSYGDNGRRNAPTNESSSQALVGSRLSRCYDWSNDFDVRPINYALMDISSSSSSSSSDNEVQNYSKQCLESFKTLQKNFDSERENIAEPD
ncbi:retrovirus-related pol polyprotein from transposon TNT 1-94 [Tanacetum coccineum]